MFLPTSSPSLIFPLLLSYSSRCSILVETSSYHLPLSAARLPISVQSSPASFISFLQYLTVFLFLPLVFSPSSNSSSQPSAATLVVLPSSILMMCPILSHTLFSTFHLTVLIFTSFRMSCMLIPFLCISLSRGSLLLLRIYLRHLSENCCNFFKSFAYHILVAQSNKKALSTHASFTLACIFFVNRVFFSCLFTLHHSAPALFFLFLTSSSAPIQHPSILIFFPSSLPSSFLSLFLSSKDSITLFIFLTPSSISPLCPTTVVSSANSERVISLLSASQLYRSQRLPLGQCISGLPSPLYSHLLSSSFCFLLPCSFCTSHYRLMVYIEEAGGCGASFTEATLCCPLLSRSQHT